MKSSKFILVTAVWGEEYVKNFMEITVPSLLAKNNLPFLSNKTDVLFYLYTKKESFEGLINYNSFKKLLNIVTIKLFNISGFSNISKHQYAAQSIRNCIKINNNSDCTYIVVYPDVIWSNGAVKRLYELERGGKKIVFSGEPRLNRETFIPKIKEKYLKGSIIDIRPRDLVKISLNHIHPEIKAMFWESNKRSKDPSYLFWEVETSGILLRSCILNPIMLKISNAKFLPDFNIDSDYLGKLFGSFNKVNMYVVEDSDDFCTMDFTSSFERLDEIEEEKMDVKYVSNWILNNTHDLQKDLLNFSVRIHCEDINSHWDIIDSKANKIIDQIKLNLKKGSKFKIGYAAPGDYKNTLFNHLLTIDYITKLIKERSLSNIIYSLFKYLKFLCLNLISRKIKIKEIKQIQ